MNVSAWAIRHPVPCILLFVLLGGAGLLAFRATPVQNFPDVDLPLVTVTASLPGAAPEQLETTVARPLEDAIATLDGLRHLYTTVQDGVVGIAAEFRLEKPPQEALDDTRAAVARVRADLPAALRDPVVRRIEFKNEAILGFAVESSMLDEAALTWLVDGLVTRRLRSVPGVGTVRRIGGVERQVRVELDSDRLLALRINAADIARSLAQMQREVPAGQLRLDTGEQTVRTVVDAASAAELSALEIPLPDGRRTRLDEVAHVGEGSAERRSGAFLDGRPVVGFDIVRSRNAGDLDVARGVRAALRELQAERPDLRFTETFNSVDAVRENYLGSLSLLLEGALLAVVIVGLFLRDLRATLISGAALPLSVMPTFLAMHALGFSLNIITLLALSLVVGILVDDAIVEIENIMRHQGEGRAPRDAAREAAAEIGLAVIATTFALVAVFLPTAFMDGLAGRFFRQFDWTAAIAVFVSLLVARLLTPMMAANLLRPSSPPQAEPFWMPAYLAAARWAFTHRRSTLALAAAFAVAGCLPLAAGMVKTDFMPPEDHGQTRIKIELPPGSRWEQTHAVALQAWQLIAGHPHVRQVFAGVGADGGATDEPGALPEARTATLVVSLTPRRERAGVSRQRIETDLRQRLQDLPGVRVNVGAGETYTLALSGEDSDVLARHAAVVERELRSLPGVGQVSLQAALQRPEVRIRLDAARAADLGVTAEAIADTVRIATLGDHAQLLPRLDLGRRQVPVVTSLPAAATTDLDLLRQLTVPGESGAVPLREVADITFASGPAQISRLDRLRTINIDIALEGQAMGDIAGRIAALPSPSRLPAGLRLSGIGQAETSDEAGRGFVLAMLTGIACIYLVLVLLFGAWLQPLTILGALLLSLPGAILALLVTGTHLGLPAMIGMVMLMGIASKNSILLVDYAIVAERDHGLPRLQALLDACRKRARPIIMTTLAMGAGMLPIALGFGADPGFRAPMAIVVIGGLVTSTLLSLLVIPVVYLSPAGSGDRRQDFA